MKKLLSVLLLIPLLFACGAKRATDASIVYFDTPTSTCTAFSINEDKAYFLTANHCIRDTFTLNGHIAYSVYENPTLDLAVVESPGAAAPAFHPSMAESTVGTSVTAIGYANGWQVLQHFSGKVSAMHEDTIYFDFLLSHGMSGGPILDTNGDVVAISQLIDTDCNCSISLSLKEVLAATGQFWER